MGKLYSNLPITCLRKPIRFQDSKNNLRKFQQTRASSLLDQQNILKILRFQNGGNKMVINFMSCNFGPKSYFWFQIKNLLRTRLNLKSLIWFQTKLHSTQFNNHYITTSHFITNIVHFLSKGIGHLEKNLASAAYVFHLCRFCSSIVMFRFASIFFLVVSCFSLSLSFIFRFRGFDRS